MPSIKPLPILFFILLSCAAWGAYKMVIEPDGSLSPAPSASRDQQAAIDEASSLFRSRIAADNDKAATQFGPLYRKGSQVDVISAEAFDCSPAANRPNSWRCLLRATLKLSGSKDVEARSFQLDLEPKDGRLALSRVARIYGSPANSMKPMQEGALSNPLGN